MSKVIQQKYVNKLVHVFFRKVLYKFIWSWISLLRSCVYLYITYLISDSYRNTHFVATDSAEGHEMKFCGEPAIKSGFILIRAKVFH